MQRFDQPTLVLDASCPELFVGLAAGGWRASATTTEPVLETLFAQVESVLHEAGVGIDSVRSFVCCRGPGSVLGLRLCAMAFRTWSRLLQHQPELGTYTSLALAAHDIAESVAESRFMVVSDWRMDRWNALVVEDGVPGPVRAVDSEALEGAGCPLFHLTQRKGWQAPPDAARTIDYRPRRLLDLRDRPGLVECADRIELFGAGSSVFRKWTPARHQARAASRQQDRR